MDGDPGGGAGARGGPVGQGVNLVAGTGEARGEVARRASDPRMGVGEQLP